MATLGPARSSASALAFRLEEGLPRDRAEWERLAALSGNVFATPEWLTAWWEHFGRGRPVFTARAVDDDGALRALAVVYLRMQRPVRVVRFVGHGPSDELGPVCDPLDLPRATAGLVRLFRETELGDVFVGEQLRGDLEWPRELDGVVVDRGASPLIRLDGEDWESFLAGRSTSLRRQVRQLQRRLIDSGNASLRFAGDADRLGEDLDAFVALHRQRFGSRSGFLMSPAVEAFHRTFAHAAFARGWLRLWLLEVGGGPQAAWYGFRFAGNDSFYQSGRARDAHPGSGTLLLALTVRNALEDGTAEYRFLRGSEAYKYRWANEDPGLQTIASGCTARGRLAVRAESLMQRMTRRTVLRG